MRMIVQFHKDSSICRISHLDTMRAVQRALRRSGVPLRYSEGYNPHPVLAFASALGVSLCSEAEYMDVGLSQDMDADAFFQVLAPQMPAGMKLVGAHTVDDGYPALMSITAFADYSVDLAVGGVHALEDLREKNTQALAQPLFATKMGKAGAKEVDLRNYIEQMMVESAQVVQANDGEEAEQTQVALALRCVHAPSGALNPTLLMPVWLAACSLRGLYRIKRTAFWANKQTGQGTQKLVPLWALQCPERSNGK